MRHAIALRARDGVNHLGPIHAFGGVVPTPSPQLAPDAEARESPCSMRTIVGFTAHFLPVEQPAMQFLRVVQHILVQHPKQ